jgi:1-phosphatidylinositol-3-phosphate 5-kinase
MASHKPLPNLPALKEPISNGNASTLSTEYSSHRSRLLHHAFEEVEEKGISGNKEGWIRAFEEALDELSVCLSSGKWFGCIRRAREARRAAIETKSGMVDDGGDDAPKAFPEAPRPLEDIQRLISNLPKTISPTTAGHLLLCVAPSTPVPAEDSGFSLIPSDIACSFSPGVFSVDEEGVNVMFGLNEVKGASS